MPKVPQQYEVCRLRNGVLAVVIESNRLTVGTTRVVLPLVLASGRVAVRHLNPKVDFGGRVFMLSPQQIAAVAVAELGEPLGTLDHERDRITRAIDMLLSGI